MEDFAEHGCYRCGHALIAVPGPRYRCSCNAHFCDPCINAYKAEQRQQCPRCDEPIEKFRVSRLHEVKRKRR